MIVPYGLAIVAFSAAVTDARLDPSRVVKLPPPETSPGQWQAAPVPTAPAGSHELLKRASESDTCGFIDGEASEFTSFRP